MGKKVVVRSLGTRDKAEANRLKHAAVAEILSSFEQTQAKLPRETRKATPEEILQLALEAREALERGELGPVDAEATVDAEVDRYLNAVAAEAGVDDSGDPLLPDTAAVTIRRARRAITGSLKLSLGYQWPKYLDEQSGRLTAQTVADKRRRLAEFASWYGADRDCSEVDRRVAGAYVAEVIRRRTQGDGSPISPTTMKKEVSDLRSFFDWLLVRGIVDSNPFDRMASTLRTSTRGRAPVRRPWKASELRQVLDGVPLSDPLWPLTVIGAYTGMRREEIAELKVASFDGDVLKVEEGKTAAAIRRVPVHPVIDPLLRQLAATSTDGYLISGLLRGGPDQKRAWYVGKRFGHVIRRLGIDDPGLDFHALRGTVITQLESAGVPESTIRLIVGHKRQGMTLGTYSAGVPDSVKREAISKVSYGDLDAAVRAQAPEVVVAGASKPRARG
jgi:integrase